MYIYMYTNISIYLYIDMYIQYTYINIHTFLIDLYIFKYIA
jgi:hypothetical protein